MSRCLATTVCLSEMTSWYIHDVYSGIGADILDEISAFDLEVESYMLRKDACCSEAEYTTVLLTVTGV